MWQTYKTIYAVKSTINCNTWIYQLQRIPLIGKLFKDRLYRDSENKIILSVIFSALSFIKAILYKFIYFAVFFLLPLAFLGQEDGADFMGTREKGGYFCWIFLAMNIILGGYIQHKIGADPDQGTNTCLLYLNLNPKRYFISRAVSEYLHKGITMIPAAIACSIWFRLPIIKIIILFVEMFSVRLFFDGVLGLKFFKKIRKNTWINVGLLAVAAILSITLAYAPIIIDMFVKKLAFVSEPSFLFSPVVIAFTIMLAAAGYLLNKKYQDYNDLKRDEIEQGVAAMSMMTDAHASAAVLKEKDIDVSFDSKATGKKGYDFLNEVFIRRYKKIFAKRSIRSSAIVLTGLLILGAVDLIFMKSSGKPLISEAMFSKSGLWFFALYLLAFKDYYTLALFNNIDKYLLPYSWYRKSDAIIKSYFIRLKSSFVLNAPITVSMMLGVLIDSFVLGIKAKVYVPVLIILVILTFFYSMHYLTLYYLIQPYTEDSRVKSFAYSFFNGAIYIVSYVLMQVEKLEMIAIGGIAAVIALYLIASIIMLKRRAPKSFKLR